MRWKFLSVSARLSPAGAMSASCQQKKGKSRTRNSSKAASAFTFACAIGSPGANQGRNMVALPNGSLPCIASECQYATAKRRWSLSGFPSTTRLASYHRYASGFWVFGPSYRTVSQELNKVSVMVCVLPFRGSALIDALLAASASEVNRSNEFLPVVLYHPLKAGGEGRPEPPRSKAP